MFLGTYKTYFTGSNRLVLPKKLRRELGSDDKVFIVLGPDGEIWGFNAKQWEKEAKVRLGTPLNAKPGRMERRKFFSKSEECILDNQGRFILPKEFVDHATLQNEILITGAGDHFEIWNPKKWKQIL